MHVLIKLKLIKNLYYFVLFFYRGNFIRIKALNLAKKFKNELNNKARFLG